MKWEITCPDKRCEQEAWAPNIVELIRMNRDRHGYFVCGCGKRGYVAKKFMLQEAGKTWSPFLLGVIPLGEPRNTYQPFAFLVGHERTGPIDSVVVSYYKDLRHRRGGRLKMGYGPGGPPVLNIPQVKRLVRELKARGCMRG